MHMRFKPALVLTLLILSQQAAALSVFTCEPEWAGLARQLAPGAEVFSATHAHQDPHYIEARPSLISRLRSADLAICSGAGLEAGWLPALQQRSANPAVQTDMPGMLFAADHTDTIDQLESAGFGAGHVHPEGNPHLHLDPERLALVAQAISERLIELDPDSAETYRSAHQQWAENWTESMARWRSKASTLRGTRILAQHTTFDYLWRWLGIEVVADLEPKPGVPPTASHLASLITTVESSEPMAIVHAWYQSPQSAQWLGQKTGTPVLALPSTLSSEEGLETPTHLFDRILAQLLEVKRG
ncbi:MAG: ABC transporter substrate-binding protein [Oceanospirillaceae bacterium]|nr:ABC transporter substrate-binding protein [Oceanospirillaceae bacterium]